MLRFHGEGRFSGKNPIDWRIWDTQIDGQNNKQLYYAKELGFKEIRGEIDTTYIIYLSFMSKRLICAQQGLRKTTESSS